MTRGKVILTSVLRRLVKNASTSRYVWGGPATNVPMTQKILLEATQTVLAAGSAYFKLLPAHVTHS